MRVVVACLCLALLISQSIAVNQRSPFLGFTANSSVSIDLDYDAYAAGSSHPDNITVTVNGIAEPDTPGDVVVSGPGTISPTSFTLPNGGQRDDIDVTFPSEKGSKTYTATIAIHTSDNPHIHQPISPTPSCIVKVCEVASLSVTGASDCGCDENGVCFVTRKGTGDVEVTALLDPSASASELAPNSVGWSAGTTGSDQLHRKISKATASDPYNLTATCGTQKSMHAHIVDSAEPPANTACPKFPCLSATAATVPDNCFGICRIAVGEDGIVAPTYSVEAYLGDDAKWHFRVQCINHIYKIGTHPRYRTEIDSATDSDIDDAVEAQCVVDDFTPPIYYLPCPYSVYIHMPAVQAHEEAHATRFYSAEWWQQYMTDFENELECTPIPFDCTSTKSAQATMDGKKSDWDNAIVYHHDTCVYHEGDGSERTARDAENGVLAPLITAINTQWGL
jgi:hypothetical protein